MGDELIDWVLGVLFFLILAAVMAAVVFCDVVI